MPSIPTFEDEAQLRLFPIGGFASVRAFEVQVTESDLDLSISFYRNLKIESDQ